MSDSDNGGDRGALKSALSATISALISAQAAIITITEDTKNLEVVSELKKATDEMTEALSYALEALKDA